MSDSHSTPSSTATKLFCRTAPAPVAPLTHHSLKHSNKALLSDRARPGRPLNTPLPQAQQQSFFCRTAPAPVAPLTHHSLKHTNNPILRISECCKPGTGSRRGRPRAGAVRQKKLCCCGQV